MHMTTAAERMGCPTSLVGPEYINSLLESIQISIESEDREDLAPYRRSDLVTTGYLLVIEYYLVGDRTNAVKWAYNVLDFADEYFFGNWRDRIHSGNYHNDPPDRAWWDKYASWQPQFEACLLSVSCLTEWERLQKFASYFREDVDINIEQSPENRAWLLTVARALLGKSLDGELANVIKSGKRKREKLLLDFLEAVLSGDERQLNASAAAYFKYYLKSEAPKLDITKKVAIDATFLVHFAAHRGRKIEIPQSVQDHIVPQLKLSSN
jgi:hypothetical protein